jgi:RsiW-degrading membrane proteinase PrsW (M82 family)
MHYLSWRGKISGPYDKEKILSMLQKGLIGNLHQVSDDCVNWKELSRSGLIPENNQKQAQVQSHAKPAAELVNDQADNADNSDSSRRPVEQASEEKKWFIYRNNNTFGPYPEHQMKKYAEDAKLFPSDLICDSKNRKWQPADNIFELQNRADSYQETTTPATCTNITFDYLVPWSKMINANILKKDIVRLILVFALAPMLISAVILNLLGPQNAFEYNKYLFYFWGIYFSLIWAGAFSLIIKPVRDVWWQGLWFAIFTAILGVLFLFNAQKLPGISYFYAKLPVVGQALPDMADQLIGFILGVGVCEELTKALPFLFFALSKKCTKTEFIFLGMMSGFGFAIAENIQYSFANIINASSSVLSESKTADEAHVGIVLKYGNILTDQLIRYITLPILHASWTGVFGWFFAISLSNPQNKWFILA